MEKVENSLIIGIDVGFGYTKTYAGEDKILIQPSLASEYIVPYYSFGFQSLDVVLVEDKQFVTGESVKRFGLKATATVRADFFSSDEALALVISSIYGVSKNSPQLSAKVVLGFPPGVFSESLVEQTKARLMGTRFSYKENSKVCPVVIEDVIFVPQGLGAYIAYLHDTQKQETDATCVVVDVGYHTVDFVLIIKGTYAFNKCISHPIGVKALFDAVKDGVSKKYGFLIPEEAVEKILRKGEFTHFGVKYSYNFSNELRNYRNLLLSYLKNYAEEVDTVVDEVILAGGGSVFLSSSFSGVYLVNYPQIANARGYYLYGRAYWQR